MAPSPVVIFGGISGSALLALAQLPIRKQMLTMLGAEWIKILVRQIRGHDIPADILWFYALSFAATALQVLMTATEDFKIRVMAAMQLVWASRLATYLSHRLPAGAITGNAYGGVTKKIGSELWLQFNHSLIGGLWRVLTCVPLWLRHARMQKAVSSEHEKATEDVDKKWSIFNSIGAAIWMTGLSLETVADLQKLQLAYQFPGQFANTGLWKLSRHPNYFGEMLVWLGHFLVGVPYAQPLDWLVASLSPIFTFLLLRYVSGVPLVTLAARKKWGKSIAFQEYMRTTPVLIPWPR